jgi:methyl-accepting chemotaxis protein
MIAQLRTISTQVQGAAYAVNATADTILGQMNDLIVNMEQQSTSVDHTTMSVEKITDFIDVVAQNTSNLLAAADQILSSIRETRASIEEVTATTGSLSTDLSLISSSVEQANQTMKQISENTGELEQIAQHTATEIHQINQVLGDVSQNADKTKQLARETMEAATRGQSSVEASIQGMADLKTVVSDTVRIIQEVSSWGAQVSSILNIVDEITEQTALLSLNSRSWRHGPKPRPKRSVLWFMPYKRRRRRASRTRSRGLKKRIRACS